MRFPVSRPPHLKYAPYLDETRFYPAIQRYLEATAREALLHHHITDLSATEGPGKVPQRVWEAATAASRLASQLGSSLGLDPLGHAKIRALSVSADATQESLVDLQTRGKAIRQRRAQALAAADEPDDEDT